MSRKFRRIGSFAAALGVMVLVGSLFAPTALAADSYTLVGCKSLPEFSGAKICFYYDNDNSTKAKGQLINNSNSGIRNDGGFENDNEGVIYTCNLVTTAAHTTSTCYKTVGHGVWLLEDNYFVGNNKKVVGTASHLFQD